MATNFGYTRRIGTLFIDDSYDKIVLAYATLKSDMEDMDYVESSLDLRGRSMELAQQTRVWCQQHPLSEQTMTAWGAMMSRYIESPNNTK